MLLQWFHWWIANHDVLVGRNQVAYAENVFLRDPEFVSLWQKSENYALTDNDLVLSKLRWANFLWTNWWKIYKNWTNDQVWDVWNNAVINMFSSVWTDFYVWIQRGLNNLARIPYAQMPWESWWVSWTVQAQAWYNWSVKSWTDCPLKYTSSSDSASSSFYLYIFWGSLQLADGNLTYTALPTVQINGVWLWRTLNYIKAFASRWRMHFTDWANNTLNATQDMAWRYIEGIYGNNIELLVAWRQKENTVIYVPSGEWKEMIARSRLSWPDQKKVHFYGREFPNLPANPDTRQAGNDTYWNFNNVTYMINDWAIMSYGAIMPWLSNSRNIETISNYNDDTISEIGMVKVETGNTTNRLYYSWRSWSVCWVDRIDLNKINNPDTYWARWELHTQKFDFWDNKVYINKVKIKAYTTAWQTIKVYTSIDWEAFELKQTLNENDPKKYFMLDCNVECYTIQWKFVLETDDDTKTPKIYAFSFIPKVWNNE